MTFSSFLHRIQRGLSSVEMIHTSHPRWPLPPGRAHLLPTIQISVLDSSFNPPTLAHLALASILRPSPLSPGSSADIPIAAHPSTVDFDARLLLLSVRNADKQLKPGDATYEQRMEMMVLLTQDLARTPSRDLHTAHTTPLESIAHESNVAVAIIDEPTFVGKSALLLDFLHKRISDLYSGDGIIPAPQSLSPRDSTSTQPPSPKLTFLMGTDTIVRFFAARYYASEGAMQTALHRFLSPAENDSRIICARRVSRGVSREEEEKAETQLPDFVRDVAPADHIAFVDIGEKECAYSSSEVREKIAKGDESWRTMVTPRVAAYVEEHRLYSPA
ncbi:Nucleotidylyl transferase [Lentinus tigrinus ALCF2SS1-6]|uniref:Nucleotidylyl transferase n=1 Tax=Lentinus tigrinus ALCF2SS1-6 TaxID=1328759 RepID=A0A5C2S766_9APHY|nr:Nucleotidylyl transferase [Lentinus tigrinus ALCF2SS1-6]